MAKDKLQPSHCCPKSSRQPPASAPSLSSGPSHSARLSSSSPVRLYQRGCLSGRTTQEVEKIVQPSYREMKNSEGKTPYLLFTEEHKELQQEAEKWMKDTASSCMVVATLIASVMFAATFTIPNGNDDDTGKSIFLHDRSFMVFTISTALAIFSSVASGATLIILLGQDYALIAITIAAFASGTVTLSALLQFPLVSDMIRHKYSHSLLSHPENHPLF